MRVIRMEADESSSGYIVEIVDPIRGRFSKDYKPDVENIRANLGKAVVGDILEFYGRESW